MATLRLDIKQFYTDFEGLINSVVQQIIQDDFYCWKEDYITEEILRRYRQRFRSLEIKTSSSRSVKIESLAYKLGNRLNAERRFGDVALIVKIYYLNRVLEGVAFLEAKKRQKDGKRFDALKQKQLEIINIHAPHASLLLYDYKDIKANPNYNSLSLKHLNTLVPHTYAVTLPINLAVALEWRDDQLYKLSMPFSHQVWSRYLCGLDLEFDRTALDIARGYNMEQGSPQYILVVSISHGDAVPSTDIDLNSNIFSEIE